MLIVALFFQLTMYSTIGNMKALELIRQHQGKPIYEFNSNGAVSFKLNNGQFIILPEQGDSSLLFESVTEYKKFLKSPKFPEPAKAIFYKYRQQLKNISKDIQPFYEELGKKLGTKVVPVENESQLKEIFALIDARAQDYYDILVPVGVVIGEYVRKKYDLKWELTTVNAFHVYHIPILKNKHNVEFSIWKVLTEFADDKKMNAEIFLMKMKYFEQLNEANFDEE